MQETNEEIIFREAVIQSLKDTLNMGHQSVRNIQHGADVCTYLNLETKDKCVIGRLIKEEFYSEELEGESPYDDLVKEAVEKSLEINLNDKQTHILSSLQVIHDGANEDFVNKFIHVVKNNVEGLNELGAEVYDKTMRLPKWCKVAVLEWEIDNV